MVERRILPFDLRKIQQSGQCFRLRETKPGLFLLTARNRRLRIRQDGDAACTFFCSKAEFDAVWFDYFDLGTDYAAMEFMIPGEDAFLRQVFAYGKGIRILRQDPWETLVTFLISQNNNIPRIGKCVAELCGRFGKQMEGAQEERLFPQPERLSLATIDELNACGLGYRSGYVLRAAQSALKGEFDPEKMRCLGDEELRAALMRMHGVGRKVADCVMLFGFHRLDAFPTDVWIRRAVDSKYDGAFPMHLYPGYAGILQQYIFYYARNAIPKAALSAPRG